MQYTYVLLTATFLVIASGCVREADIPINGTPASIVEGEDFRPGSPGEHMQWRMEQRGGSFKMQELLKGKRHAERMLQRQQTEDMTRDAGIMGWEWKGPGNIGGRVRGMAIKDNGSGGDEILIGAAGGGIWRSTNGGGSWTAMNDFLPSLAVTSIQIDPDDDDIMYAATGEGFWNGDAIPGAGIFKSTDGGLTWTQLPSTANFTWVNRIAIDPDSTTKIFAVTRSPYRIRRSLDGGATWPHAVGTLSTPLDVKVSPHDSDHILVGCRSHLYESTDGGTTFTEITGGANQIPDSAGRVEIAFAPSDANVIYASVDNNFGEIWCSTDAGSTWTRMSTGFNHLSKIGWYANALWVDPLNANNLVTGGVDIFKSTDGGATLTRISDWHDYHNGGSANSAHADNHIFLHSNNYSSGNPRVYVGNDGGIQKADNIWTVSQNSGWTNLAGTTLGITQFYGADAATDGSIYSGGTQDNCFMYGNSALWIQPVHGDGAYAAIHKTNPNIRYANTNHHGIWKTDDGVDYDLIAGFGYSDTSSVCPDIYAGCVHDGAWKVADGAPLISRFIMDPNDSETIWVCARRLWKNAAAGDANSWVVVKDTVPGKPIVQAIDSEDNSDIVWVGYSGSGRIERSLNGGSTWSGDLDTSAMANAGITDIDIHPAYTDEVMVSIGGYNQSNIWYTDDDGSTWHNRSLPFNMQVNTVLWHPQRDGWVYIGTDIGIFASEDYGQNWSVTPLHSTGQGNEGPVYTEVSELFWQGNGTLSNPYYLCAATHGRGLWVSAHPVYAVLYVDKDYVGVEDGTITRPFNTLKEAHDVAGHGVTIKFLSTSTHDEVPPMLLLDKRVHVDLLNGGIVIE